MNVRYFLYLLLFITQFTARAQNGTLTIGAVTGLNISSLHSEIFNRFFDWRYSEVKSIQINYALSEKWSVVSGVNYESKGCKGKNMKLLGIENTSLGSDHTFDYALEYVTFPFLVRYTDNRFPVYVNAGPYFGHLLNYAETYDIVVLERTSDINENDFGISFGAGAIFDLSDELNLTIELRNNLGLTNIKESDEGYKNVVARPVEDLSTIRNNSINILIGLHYKL